MGSEVGDMASDDKWTDKERKAIQEALEQSKPKVTA